jgi:microcompartment protein CcmL/EutN
VPESALPALGILELGSIARGVVVADAMAKKAPVRILQNHPISPGKHLVVIAGMVAEVEESLGEGLGVAGATVVDRLFLPQAHEQLEPMVAGQRTAGGGASDAACIFETFTVCSTVLAADAAAKAAGVTLLEMRLGQGLGGKGYFTMTGTLDSIEAAAAAAREIIDGGLLCGVEIIPSPHPDFRNKLIW